jgi:hypothetical protein
VSYSCITVNPSPPAIPTTLADGQSAAYPITTFTNILNAVPVLVPVTSISISWNENDDTSPTFSGCTEPAGEFNPENDTTDPSKVWPATCDPGVLQVDLLPDSALSSTSSQQNGTYDFFLYPQNAANGSSTTSIDLGAAPGAASRIYPVNCGPTEGYNNAPGCTANITVNPATTYYTRVLSIYRTDDVTLSANNGQSLFGAAAEIDATGKAQNILQRLRAYVPLSNIGNGLPNYALQTGDSLCKLVQSDGSGAASQSLGGPLNGTDYSSDEGCVPK